MPITLDGSGTITGLSAGGLPDGTITTADIADNAVTPGKILQKLTSAGAVSATGTSLDFTGIPSWVRRITVQFYRMSTNGSSLPVVRVGTSSGVVSSGYESVVGYSSAGGTVVADTQHFGLAPSGGWSAAISYSGTLVITNISGNNWVASLASASYSSIQIAGGGSVTLAATLDRLRITTVNGTDAFDAGTVNILYE